MIQAHNRDIIAGFLPHFAHDGLVGPLAGFDGSAGRAQLPLSVRL